MIQIDESRFKLKHISGDTLKDINFEMFIDEDMKIVEWDNLPKCLEINMSMDFETLKAYPLLCINKVLADQFENVEGLRPEKEYYSAEEDDAENLSAEYCRRDSSDGDEMPA